MILYSDNFQVGRPPVRLQREDLVELRALHFSWTKIARILGVSRQTIYRKLEEFDISCNDHSTISSLDLDSLLQQIKRDHPNDGEVMMRGHLISLGIRVPRSQVRESIHRVDHQGIELRKSHVVKHRQYFVESPNSVWHIDGHHKLIRWRFVVHAAIDGFSRVIPYITCADNNRAMTVIEAFYSGVACFGLPEKVRSDHGGENMEVWKYMLVSHNDDPQCVITGSSTHNERIERLWRDVHRSLSHLKDSFLELESEGILLDLLNEVDVFSLHYVFLPMINKCLQDFQESWNNHSLSTEGSMTPYQLFAEGMNYAAQFDVPTIASIQAIPTTQADEQKLPTVDVPRIAFTQCITLTLQLQILSQLSGDIGKQLYIQVTSTVGQHLLNGCDNCHHN